MAIARPQPPTDARALDRFRQGVYDVVVTDCAMPELFGDQMAAAIKELSPQTPVILITGLGISCGRPKSIRAVWMW